jgi:hypothetical protein
MIKTNTTNKNNREFYSGINEFNKRYQLRTNFARNQMGNLLAYSNNILNMWMNYSSQLLKIHGVNYVR